MWTWVAFVAQDIFLRSIAVEFRVGCLALLCHYWAFCPEGVHELRFGSFRYPWQGKLRRKACLAKWVHLSLIHLQGACNIYSSFEMQRMQDLRPVESQAVCTMTGVCRSEKLCRYAGRVIYEIYKCDAPWPGNEWCKLESTKNPPMSSTSKLPRGFKVSLRWRKGLFESIPGLVNCFFCVNCGCSTGAGCLRFGELTLKGVFFLCKERHTLMKLWFLFRNLSLLSELPIYQPLSTWHVVTLPKNDAHCDSRSASIRRLLGKTFRQEAARGAHIWGMFTFSGAIGMKMKRVPRWERTSWRATLVQPRTMPFNPSGTHPSKHQASQLRKFGDEPMGNSKRSVPNAHFEQTPQIMNKQQSGHFTQTIRLIVHVPIYVFCSKVSIFVLCNHFVVWFIGGPNMFLENMDLHRRLHRRLKSFGKGRWQSMFHQWQGLPV